jgi:hypothetical protein
LVGLAELELSNSWDQFDTTWIMHPTRIVNVFLFVVFVRSPRNLSRNSSTTKPRLLHLPKKRETRPETDEFIYIFCTDNNSPPLTKSRLQHQTVTLTRWKWNCKEMNDFI